MNKETAKDYLPLVQALAEGRVIQYSYKRADSSLGWLELEDGVQFDQPADQYRIKPEPREIWVNRYTHANTENGMYVYGSREDALKAATNSCHESTPVRYREVIE